MSYELSACPPGRRRFVPPRRFVQTPRWAPRYGQVARSMATPATLARFDSPPNLGFSLKPPKRFRKLLKKAAVPLLIGAAMLIPGVAPAVGVIARTVGGGLIRGAVGVARGVGGIFRPKAPSTRTGPIYGPPVPPGMPTDQGTTPGTPAPGYDMGYPTPTGGTTGPSPTDGGVPESAAYPIPQSMMDGGGGELGPGPQPKPGINPLLIGGLVVGGLVFAGMAARKRGR